MHGTTVKIIEAQKAELCISYQNTKLKLLKTNAAIWFKKMCRIKQLKPNYINIKINGKKVTRQEDRNKCDQIQGKSRNKIYLLQKKKKQKLNQQLYHIHIKCAHYCNGMWQHIQN
jgi:hypothetical protein